MNNKNEAASIIKTIQFGLGIDTEINGLEKRPEIDPCIYGNLIYSKGGISIQEKMIIYLVDSLAKPAVLLEENKITSHHI